MAVHLQRRALALKLVRVVSVLGSLQALRRRRVCVGGLRAGGKRLSILCNGACFLFLFVRLAY